MAILSYFAKNKESRACCPLRRSTISPPDSEAHAEGLAGSLISFKLSILVSTHPDLITALSMLPCRQRPLLNNSIV